MKRPLCMMIGLFGQRWPRVNQEEMKEKMKEKMNEYMVYTESNVSTNEKGKGLLMGLLKVVLVQEKETGCQLDSSSRKRKLPPVTQKPVFQSAERQNK